MDEQSEITLKLRKFETPNAVLAKSLSDKIKTESAKMLRDGSLTPATITVSTLRRSFVHGDPSELWRI